MWWLHVAGLLVLGDEDGRGGGLCSVSGVFGLEDGSGAGLFGGGGDGLGGRLGGRFGDSRRDVLGVGHCVWWDGVCAKDAL